MILVTHGVGVESASGEVIFVLDDQTPAFSDGLNNGDVVSSGGIDLTFSNVVVANGGLFGDVEDWGILLSSTTEVGLTDVISFDFSFSHDVQLQTYDIGARESVGSGRFFTISGSNGTSGENLIPSGTSFTESTHNFMPGTIPYFEAGEVYSFTHNLPDDATDPLFNLEQLVVTSVPEPGSVGLLAAGALAAVIRRRRKANGRY